MIKKLSKKSHSICLDIMSSIKISSITNVICDTKLDIAICPYSHSLYYSRVLSL